MLMYSLVYSAFDRTHGGRSKRADSVGSDGEKNPPNISFANKSWVEQSGCHAKKNVNTPGDTSAEFEALTR